MGDVKVGDRIYSQHVWHGNAELKIVDIRDPDGEKDAVAETGLWIGQSIKMFFVKGCEPACAIACGEWISSSSEDLKWGGSAHEALDLQRVVQKSCSANHCPNAMDTRTPESVQPQVDVDEPALPPPHPMEGYPGVMEALLELSTTDSVHVGSSAVNNFKGPQDFNKIEVRLRAIQENWNIKSHNVLSLRRMKKGFTTVRKQNKAESTWKRKTQTYCSLAITVIRLRRHSPQKWTIRILGTRNMTKNWMVDRM